MGPSRAACQQSQDAADRGIAGRFGPGPPQFGYTENARVKGRGNRLKAATEQAKSCRRVQNGANNHPVAPLRDACGERPSVSPPKTGKRKVGKTLHERNGDF